MQLHHNPESGLLMKLQSLHDISMMYAVMPYEEPITFMSGINLLQGSLYIPDASVDNLVPGVIICHPHPRAGGSMDNNVVFACCSGLRSATIAYLRFNFQGVGQSQGVAGDPDRHVTDILAASEYLKSVEGIDPSSIGVAGYSFGGSTTIKALLKGLDPTAVALIACGFPELTPQDKDSLGLPKLVILGESDSFIDSEAVSAMTGSLGGNSEIHVIPGADHFFMRSEPAISAMIGEFFKNELGNDTLPQGQPNA